MRASPTVPLLCALALVARPGASRADDLRATLSWVRGVGAESCGDAAALRQVIARHMGRDVFVPAAPLSVEASIARDGDRWVAQLFVRRADGAALGERHLTSTEPRCEALRDALAFSIVVAIDGDAVFRAPPGAAAAAPPAAPPAAPAVAAPPPAAEAARAPAPSCPRCAVCEACPAAPATPPPPAPRAPWEGSVGARGAVSLGALPGVPLGVLLRGELRPPGWPRLTASLGFWPEQTAALPVGSAAITLATASLGLCPVTFRRGRFEAAPCAAVTLLSLTAAGQGYGESHVAKGLGLSVDVGARARWAPPFAYVELGLDAAVALLRAPLAVERLGQVFDPPWVSLQAYLGAGVHFE